MFFLDGNDAGHRCQIFPTKRPGLRMRLGSNRRLISRIRGMDPRSDPHTSTLLAVHRAREAQPRCRPSQRRAPQPIQESRATSAAEAMAPSSAASPAQPRSISVLPESPLMQFGAHRADSSGRTETFKTSESLSSKSRCRAIHTSAADFADREALEHSP